jgi:hypothetical protein
MDVWKDRQAEASKTTLALRKRIEGLSERKNRLVDAASTIVQLIGKHIKTSSIDCARMFSWLKWN